MINPEHKLALTRQAELLEISRSTVYYRPRPISDADLMLMRRIDELHMNYPFAGSRMLRDMLSQQGLEVGRRHVRTLVRRMAIETLYRKPNTSKPAPGHKIFLPAARPLGHAAQSSLRNGHYIYSHGARLRLSGRGHRLVQPSCAGLAIVDHHGHIVLHRSTGRSSQPAWQA